MQPDCFAVSTPSLSLAPVPISVPIPTQNARRRSTSGNREIHQGDENQVQGPPQVQLQIQLPVAVKMHDLEITRDFVTLVRLGVNCPRCGTATEEDGPYRTQVSDRPQGAVTSLEGEDQAALVSDSNDTEKDFQNDENMATDNDSMERKELTAHSKGHGNAVWCKPCKDYALTCSLCQMPIRGAGYFCSACGHGGHTAHMRQWFEITVECAAGCGCKCESWLR